MNTMLVALGTAAVKTHPLAGRLVWRCAMALVLPALPLLGWAQQTVVPAPTPAVVQAAPQDLRSAVRLQQSSATKSAKQNNAAPKMAHNLDVTKSDGRHLTGEERAQLRKQLARELRAQR